VVIPQRLDHTDRDPIAASTRQQRRLDEKDTGTGHCGGFYAPRGAHLGDNRRVTKSEVPVSGFLVVKDAVAQGYPFVEAIRAALPLCDELWIGDGGSEDGTWEALEVVREAFAGRLHVYRDPWPPAAGAWPVTAATTRAKEHCRSPWCFQLQANEIVPASAVATLRREPALYPGAELFRLPYLTLMGGEIAWHVDFRRRLMANRSEIVARGDAFDCGYAPRKLLWRRPRRLLAFALHRRGERTVHLAEPIARYRALFPRCYLAKLRARVARSAKPEGWRRELAWAERVAEEQATATPLAFWRAMKPFFDRPQWRDAGNGEHREDVPLRCLPDREGEVPDLVRPLLDRWEYPLAESLAALKEPLPALR
jgi:hypothetical protein